MPLVACKACGKELGKGVKKCVHCGTDQRNFFGKHKIITGILVLVVLGVAAGALGGGEKASTGSDTAKSPSDQPAAAVQKLGTAFKTEQFEITVVSAEIKGKVGVEFVESKPAEGGEYVAIVWKYKNISKEPVGMFSQPSLRLVDPEGVEYESDLGATSSYASEKKLSEKVVSDLNPGITVTGAEVFEVAKGKYDPAAWKILVKADDDVSVSLK